MKNLFFSFTFLLATYFIQNINGLYENDICTNSNGKRGICKKNEDCTRLQDILKTGLRPKICGWPINGRYPIICCPVEEKPEINTPPPDNRGGTVEETDQSEQVKLVRQKCAEYGKFVKEEIEDPALGSSGKILVKDQCGRLAEPMILGGIEAKPREFPHMALIGYGDPPVYLCGGSLISEQFVLSAAHCSKPPRRGSAKVVKLGELDTSTDNEEADPVVYKIIQIINHPQYDQASLYNDITLYKLDESVIFNAFIRPICLDTNPEIQPGFLAASGWGHTEWGGAASSKLMKVSVEYVTTDVCNFNYTKTIELGKQIPRGVMDESMVCAGNEVGKDTCQGDSGGPLQANLTVPYCMYDLVGVTSFGKGCGLGYPGVYTRVSYYIPWIVQHVWPDNI